MPDVLAPESVSPPIHAGTPLTMGSEPDLRTGRERRAHTRHSQKDLQWIRIARLQFGQSVSVVDLSTGGARLDSPVALGPNSLSSLEIIGTGLEAVVPFRVLRCEVGGLTPSGLIYRGACEFIRPLKLPELAVPVARVVTTEDVQELDIALKNLLHSATAEGADRMTAPQILQAIKALHVRAAGVFSDPMGQRLNALLKVVIPAIERRSGLPSVLEAVEAQLRRVVPHARMRVAAAGDETPETGDAFVVEGDNLAAGAAVVRIDVPRTLPLTAWQSRVLRTTSRLMGILQQSGIGPAAAVPQNANVS